MELHEGALLKRALIYYQESTSAGAYRTILRITEWLHNVDPKYLNRVVLRVMVWLNTASDANAGDTIIVAVVSDGKTMSQQMVQLGWLGGGNYIELTPFYFPLFYPGAGPRLANETTLLIRALSWAITEVHGFLFEVQAYLMDPVANVKEVSF